MNKKGVIIGVIVVAIIAGVAASFSSSPSESVNLDMGRTHGTISTAMGSPILGNPSAPITIVEFGDPNFHCLSPLSKLNIEPKHALRGLHDRTTGGEKP